MAHDLFFGDTNVNYARPSRGTFMHGDFENQLVIRVRNKLAKGVEPTREEYEEINKLARLGDPECTKLVAEWKRANPGLSPNLKIFLGLSGVTVIGLYLYNKYTSR